MQNILFITIALLLKCTTYNASLLIVCEDCNSAPTSGNSSESLETLCLETGVPPVSYTKGHYDDCSQLDFDNSDELHTSLCLTCVFFYTQ